MTAATWNALVQSTKSATFLSNLFRVARSFEVMSAENATCASTTPLGNACVSRKYMACSFSVTGFRAVITPIFDDFRLFVASASAALIAISISGISKYVSFMSEFPVSNQTSQYATVVERVRAYAATGNRFAWWMGQERAELRNDPAWRQVFDHLAEAHTGAAVAAFLGVSK